MSGSPNNANGIHFSETEQEQGTCVRTDGRTIRAVWDDNCTYDLVKSISLDITNLQLTDGNSQMLEVVFNPADASNQNVSWTSSNPSVATVTDGIVSASALGITTITATSEDGNHTATCSVEVIPEEEYTYVDLGLSVKWATCNVGAGEPTQYGNYYAWGETLPKSDYSWTNYLYGSSESSLSKYNNSNTTSNGVPDNKKYLEITDDPSFELGADWRMPTSQEFQELCSNCSSQRINRDGVWGFLFSRNGKSIFLPYAGFKADSNLSNLGDRGLYWCLNRSDSNPALAFFYDFSYSYYGQTAHRYQGFSIRPVVDEYKFLSRPSTANSYLVSDAGKYSFSLYQGVGSTAVYGQTVEVLWESQFGQYHWVAYDVDEEGDTRYRREYEAYHESGSVVNNVELTGGKIRFRTTGNEGNVLIALRDFSNNIVWSWHVWVRHSVGEIDCPDGSTIMSCNLGAISDEVFLEKNNGYNPYFAGECGLLYQWGRKDPFVAYDDALWTTETKASGATIDYATKHPTTIIVAQGKDDWLTSAPNGLWSGTTKKIYDPCPPGWRIPAYSIWPSSDYSYLVNTSSSDGKVEARTEYKSRNTQSFVFYNLYIYGSLFPLFDWHNGESLSYNMYTYPDQARYWCAENDSPKHFDILESNYDDDDDCLFYTYPRSTSYKQHAYMVRCCKE